MEFENNDALNPQNNSEDTENTQNTENAEYIENSQIIEDSEVQNDSADKKKKIIKEIADWFVCILVAVIIALVVRTYIFTLVRVDGKSMVPTLSHGDTLYTNRFFYQPQNGDIIVFRPVHSPKTPYIKRVIATEGQTIDINRETCEVFVDGNKLNEDYIAEPMLSAGNMQYPVTVPEGYVFAMGDNRNHSFDSRDSRVGLVPEENIIGEAVFRILPVSDMGMLD